MSDSVWLNTNFYCKPHLHVWHTTTVICHNTTVIWHIVLEDTCI